MTRTESDLAETIAAAAEVVVDTDTFVTRIKRRARRRRQVHLAVAGVGTMAVATAVAVPASLVALGPAASGPSASAAVRTTSPPRVFTGNCGVEMIADPANVEPGRPMQLNGMDPTGRYIVGSYGPPVEPDGNWSGDRGVPVRWDNGVGMVLPVDGDNVHAFPSDVNRYGSVVGSMRRIIDGAYVWFGWSYIDDAGFELLPTPAGYDGAYAVGINDRGEIVGSATRGTRTDPVRWSAGSGGRWTARVIDSPNSNGGWAVAITDDGAVVGTLRAGEPYVWYPDGTGRLLAMPDDITWGSPIDAAGDWASGFPGNDSTRALRWNIRTGEMSVVAGDGRALFATVNARGDAAGFRPGAREAGAFLRTNDGEEYELPELSEAPPYAMLQYRPVAISEDATLIIGISGELWRC